MAQLNSDLAYDYLRSRIISGEYAPGKELLTESLAAELGFSRTPIRDALRMLRTDGLVVVGGGKIARVTKLGESDFEEICDLRLALESHAAGRSARLRDERDLESIRSALEAMRALSGKIIPLDFDHPHLGDLVQKEVQEDVRFHIAIISAAKNKLIKKEILRLHLVNRVLSRPILPTLSAHNTAEKKANDARRLIALASHQEIYDNIERSDSIGAKVAMEKHLEEIVKITLRNRNLPEHTQSHRELTAEDLLYTT